MSVSLAGVINPAVVQSTYCCAVSPSNSGHLSSPSHTDYPVSVVCPPVVYLSVGRAIKRKGGKNKPKQLAEVWGERPE